MAFESAFGWGWLTGLLEDYGFDPHMVHPLRCKAIASARLKNDKVNAAILAQLLRADLLPKARGAGPPGGRSCRAWTRHGWILGAYTRREGGWRVRAAVTGGRLGRAGAGRPGPGHRPEPGGYHRG